MQQESLWHDTPEDALKAVLQAVYGRGWKQKAAADMWPTEDPSSKGDWLERALTQGRSEKPGLEDIRWILRKGREKGVHTAMHYFNDDAGYGPPVPVEPVDELAELQRRYIQSVDDQKQMVERIQRLQIRTAG